MTLKELRAALNNIPDRFDACQVRVYASMGLAYVHKDIEGVTLERDNIDTGLVTFGGPPEVIIQAE